MSWKHNRLTQRLGLDVPIVQGPFGGGLSSVRLLKAVSDAGGLGSFGAHHLTPDQIHALVREARAATARPFAINLWVSDHDAGGLDVPRDSYERALASLRPIYRELGAAEPSYPPPRGPRYTEQVAALLDARPPVFSFVYGLPDAATLAACRERGIATIGTATTVEEAVALDRGGVDFIVATGMEAGGHRVSFLAAAEESLQGLVSLVPQVVDAVSVPVIAAGGLADGRGIAAALALGAEGVQIGTAFLACDESEAALLHKQRLLDGLPKPTMLTRAFTGRLARGLANELLRRASAPGTVHAAYPAQSALLQPIRAAAITGGDPEYVPMWSGQSASLLRQRHAAELLRSLVSDTERRFADLARFREGR
jgi:nitronate monooxygenase